MAPAKKKTTEPLLDDIYSSPAASSDEDDDDDEQTTEKHRQRAPKRRRLSSDDDDSDSDVPPPRLAPLVAAPSRIKKKRTDDPSDAKPATSTAAAEDPITSKDALDIGLQMQIGESNFAALNVAPWLVGSLSAMAIKRPTAIQKACIPEILKGRDCIGGSRTGSGKTIAFAVPILQKWAEDPFGIFAVVLTPTR